MQLIYRGEPPRETLQRYETTCSNCKSRYNDISPEEFTVKAFSVDGINMAIFQNAPCNQRCEVCNHELFINSSSRYHIWKDTGEVVDED